MVCNLLYRIERILHEIVYYDPVCVDSMEMVYFYLIIILCQRIMWENNPPRSIIKQILFLKFSFVSDTKSFGPNVK